MAKVEFEQEAVLEAYRAELTQLAEQIRTMTERQRAVEQVVAGLELLVDTRKRVAAAVEPRVLTVSKEAPPLTNAIAVLRFQGRPRTAAEIVLELESHGIRLVGNTVYKALARAAYSGIVVREIGGFGLPEWRGRG
jgi:hypothetical protein